MTLLAGGFACAAMLVGWPSGRALARQRLGTGAPIVVRPVALPLLVAVAVVPLATVLSGPRFVVGLTVAGVGLFAAQQVRTARDHDRMRARQDDVSDLLGLLAAELRAGLLPARTLAGLCEEFEFLRPAARAAEGGGDVAAALLDAGQIPGREVLREVGAAWHVAERSGAPLATVLGRLEHAVREGREIDREVQAGIAPARATGRLMAVLPIVGLALGSGMGGDPVAMLTNTWLGAFCAATGCLLACLGVAWIGQIASSAEQKP